MGFFAAGGFEGELALDAEAAGVFDHLLPDADRLVVFVLPEERGHGAGGFVGVEGGEEGAGDDDVVPVVFDAEDAGVAFDGAVFGGFDAEGVGAGLPGAGLGGAAFKLARGHFGCLPV